MSRFLKPNQKISVELPCSANEAQQVAKDLQNIVSKLSPRQINTLSKAVNDPVIKSLAIKKLKTML